MNFDDHDEPSIAFDGGGLRDFDENSDSMVNPLYASIREEDDYVSDQGHVNEMLTFTGTCTSIFLYLKYIQIFFTFNVKRVPK